DEEAVAEAESKLASAKDLKERLGSEGFTEEEEARFQELAERFAGRKLFENEEETYTEKSEKAQSLSADMRVRYERAKEAEKTLKTKTENAKRASALLKAVPIGGVLMTAAALSIAGILKSNILAVVGTILGILTVLGSLYAFLVRKKAQKEKEQTEKDCNELKADLSRMEEEKGNLTESLKGFFGRFGRSYELETGTVELHRLFREYREYKRMTERKSVHSQDLREIDEKMRSVRSFLLDFVPAPSDDMTEELRALRTRVFSYHTAETEFVNAKRAYDEFESDPESSVLQDIRKPDFPESAEQLTSRLAELNREIDEIREESESYQREETRLSEKMETLFDAEAELDELFVKRSILADRLETVRMARSFLKEAKQSLSEKVTDPVTKGFRDYVSDIVPDMKTSLNISADGNAVFEEGSAIRGVDLFSQGYRTLTYFALRLSLMDQMFENDAPPLFLDDPFQSLDESKLKTALKLLKKASERYQILYFTCHESRSEASVSVQ
ncbi:MAG: hypothetical protein IK088_01940, partial [Lachnospiraceae bacterium]|nr:hypothetical protein [Lachnospiraceae bacterium]